MVFCVGNGMSVWNVSKVCVTTTLCVVGIVEAGISGKRQSGSGIAGRQNRLYCALPSGKIGLWGGAARSVGSGLDLSSEGSMA
jgi:hypothetical protein